MNIQTQFKTYSHDTVPEINDYFPNCTKYMIYSTQLLHGGHESLSRKELCINKAFYGCAVEHANRYQAQYMTNYPYIIWQMGVLELH